MRNQIEALRRERGWTQQEVADRVNVSRQTILSLESGRYNPSILLAFRLARLFEMPVEILFQDDGDENDEQF